LREKERNEFTLGPLEKLKGSLLIFKQNTTFLPAGHGQVQKELSRKGTCSDTCDTLLELAIQIS
jgi:hypothetical protein